MNDIWTHIWCQSDRQTIARCKLCNHDMHTRVVGFETWCESTGRFRPTAPISSAHFYAGQRSHQEHHYRALLPGGSIIHREYETDYHFSGKCASVVWDSAQQRLLMLQYTLPNPPANNLANPGYIRGITHFHSAVYNCIVEVAKYEFHSAVVLSCTVIDVDTVTTPGSILVKSMQCFNTTIPINLLTAVRFCFCKFINENEICAGIHPDEARRPVTLYVLHLHRANRTWQLVTTKTYQYVETPTVDNLPICSSRLIHLHYLDACSPIIAWFLCTERTGSQYLMAFSADPDTGKLAPTSCFAQIPVYHKSHICICNQITFDIDTEHTLVAAHGPPTAKGYTLCAAFNRRTPQPVFVCQLDMVHIPSDLSFFGHTAWRCAFDQTIMYTMCYVKDDVYYTYTYDLSHEGILVAQTTLNNLQPNCNASSEI